MAVSSLLLPILLLGGLISQKIDHDPSPPSFVDPSPPSLVAVSAVNDGWESLELWSLTIDCKASLLSEV
jgi:hypothetical protein